MFSLSYQLMTQTLQRMHYTGMAQATIPSGLLAGGTVFLQVQSGKILAGIVVTADGKHVTDAQLITENLLQISMLEWNLTANPTNIFPAPLPTPPAPTPIPPSFPSEQDARTPPIPSSETGALSPYSYPRRVPVDPTLMSTWPFVYRQVYNLSTGHYSEQDIGRLLRYPQAELVKAFDDLQRMHVIQRRT